MPNAAQLIPGAIAKGNCHRGTEKIIKKFNRFILFSMSLCLCGQSLFSLRGCAIKRRPGREELFVETAVVLIEQLFDALKARRSEDQPGMIFLLQAINNL